MRYLRDKQFLFIFGAVLIVIMTIATMIYEMTQEKRGVQSVQLLPYFSEQKHLIEKIEIITPEKPIILVRKDKKWFIETEDNFPADSVVIGKLYDWIEELQTISRKTDDKEKFARVNLLNPSGREKTGEGFGTRIILRSSAKTPIVDMIMGARLNSFIMRDHIRFFMRSGFGGGAYLIEGGIPPNMTISGFMAKNIGFPAMETLRSLELYIAGRSVYRLNAVSDNVFMPEMLPIGKRLIYPEITTDYVRAVLQKIHPISAKKLDFKAIEAEDKIVLTHKDGKKTILNFKNIDDKAFYLMVISPDNVLAKQYIYEISEEDYKGVLQPFSVFITDDVRASQQRDIPLGE